MKREEPRTGAIADFEFQFWECWESDDNVAGAIERHWFRSDTGLEAPTYDHMLQKLYRQKLGLPVVPQMPTEPQCSATSEWDKRTPCVVQVNGKEVVIEICEHYTEATGGAPVSTKFVGPNGLVTSTYPEMLERLGVAPRARQSALGSQHSARANDRRSALGSQHSARENRQSALGPPQADISAKQKTTKVSTQVLATAEGDSENFVISQDGNLVVPSALEEPVPVIDARQGAEVPPSTVSVSDPAQSAPGGSPQKQEPQSVVNPSRTNVPLAKIDCSGGVAACQNGKSEAGDGCGLDARDMEEAKTRGEEFEKRHPWLWEDPDEKVEEPMNSMRLVWWGEYIRAVYPELAAAALDSVKYEAYIESYDYEKPIPLNQPDEEQSARKADDAPRCQFIKADGERCGSPALRRKRFCYFHSKTAEDRQRKKTTSESRAAVRSPLEMPVLEDDLAIKMAVSNICRQLANETIDPKRAATLLYGMQVAAVAVRRAQTRPILNW